MDAASRAAHNDEPVDDFAKVSRTMRQRALDRVVMVGLIILGAVVAWRAYSQAITYDEAFTWLAFVRGPLGNVFTSFTANNHILFTFLAWLTTHGFGVSELTLRLPSVAAAAAYLLLSRALARAVCGPGMLHALVIAALVLNPFVLDFLVAARGYGLATTALLFALLHVLQWETGNPPTTRHMLTVGLALGISIASNLALVFPSAGLAAAYVVLVALGASPATRSVLRAAAWVGMSAAFVTLPLLIRPLRETHPGFYYGAETFAEASRSLVAASLQFDRTGRWHAPDGVVDGIAWVIVPLALAGWALCAIAVAIAARRPAPSDHRWPLVVVGATLGFTVAGRALAHVGLGIPLPLDRTGLYLLPLFVLGIAASARALEGGASFTERWSRGACAAAIAALTLAYAAQFTTSHFREWRFDAGSREIFTRVERWACPADRPRRLTTTPWLYEPALEFYRVIRQAGHVQPLNIDHETYVPGDADFYVIQSADDVSALSRVAAVVFVHPVSGASLLVDRSLAGCEFAREQDPPEARVEPDPAS